MSLFSRVMFVIVLACAAVPFIIGQHVSKASPSVDSSDGGEQLFLKSYKRFGLLPSEPGRPTRARSEIARSWKDPDQEAPLVHSLLHRKGHWGYNPNAHRNQAFSEQMSQVHRGQHWAGAKPIGTHPHSDSQISRMNHHSLFHAKSQNGGPSGFAAPHNGNSKPWYPPIMRKSSLMERPLPQRSNSQAQNVYDNGLTPRSGKSTQPESRIPDNSPPPSWSGSYWRQHMNTNGRSIDGKVQNAGASNVHASKFPSFLKPKSFIAPSSSSSKDSSVAKPEKLTSPIAQFSQGRFPPKSSERTSYKRVQSSLLPHSHTSDAHNQANTQNLEHKTYKGQDFNQQIRPRAGNVGKGDHPASFIFRAPKRNTPSPYEDTDVANRNAKSGQGDSRDNVQPKERFSLNKGLSSWSSVKKNSQPSIYPKETNFETSNFRLIRPSRLQKYSFEQRIPSRPSSQEIVRHSSHEILEATTRKSSPESEYGSPSIEKIEEKAERKSPAKSVDVFESVTHTTVKPQPETDPPGTILTPFNGGDSVGKDDGAREVELKALTYDDIIGSASFSSVMPVETVQKTGVRDNTVNASLTNGTEDSSVAGKVLDFRKGEAESELGISDWSVSEGESEAKNVPHGLLSDPKENIESDSSLELDYLRTSTGNVSFQSLSLNL